MAHDDSGPRGFVARYLNNEAASGILLALAAAVALVLANSSAASSYHGLLAHEVGLEIAGIRLATTVHHLVADGLMTVFFFSVGLEIRRELHAGELADRRRAALPAVAALGGMIAPAVVYLLVIGDRPERDAWGIPTATDIAFAVGALSLLGRRVAPALRILLLSLAILDDIGGVLVIAVVYSDGIVPRYVGVAAIGIVMTLAMQANGFRRPLAYLVPAIVVWVGFHGAGVHPTMAGVLLGLLTPPRPDRDGSSASSRLQERLHPWVAFGVMPLFALASAGVELDASAADTRIVAAVALGLLLGKPIGILSAVWVAVRLRIAALPTGVGWLGLAVVGTVAGVGFTVALFVAALALPDAQALASAKLGVLLGSGGALVLGVLGGGLLLRPSGDR